MLVSKEVEVKINKKNIEWYRSKGIDCELKDIVAVNVKELVPNSKIEVEYVCDGCNEVSRLPFASFNRRQSINKKTYCKKCSNEIRIKKKTERYIVKDGFKVCNECERRLLANTDYYHQATKSKDGFSNKCKECVGGNFTNKLTYIPKEGYKFCVKCNREFPINIKYFPPDKMCKDGFRNVCRECGKDGHFMKDDYVKNKYWTEEEKEILKEVYPHYTNEELIKLYFPDATKRGLESQAYAIGSENKTDKTIRRGYDSAAEKKSGENSHLYGKPRSEETIKKFKKSIREYYSKNDGWWLGKKRSEKQKKQLSERMKGNWSGDTNPRYNNPLKGKDNGNWKGGLTPLYHELRSEITDWKNKSMEKCNYKCVLTFKNFDNIHHLYPFKNIVDEVFDLLEIDKRQQVKDYSEEEFSKIREKLIELHDFYGEGVCISKELHKIFHDVYGYKDNTPEQFYEFEKRYKNSEFDNLM